MAIAIFRSLEGENLEDYSIRLAQQWRIGRKGLDNGVILLVFARDRRVRFEVGYGLEAALPDALAGQIIREALAPRFREQRYAAGLEDAVNLVFARLAGAGGTPERQPPPGASPFSVDGIAAVLVLALFAVFAASFLNEALNPRRRARRNVYTAGSSGWFTPIGMWGRGGGWGSGGGFSGGGGSFGGGGASGGW